MPTAKQVVAASGVRAVIDAATATDAAVQKAVAVASAGEIREVATTISVAQGSVRNRVVPSPPTAPADAAAEPAGAGRGGKVVVWGILGLAAVGLGALVLRR